MQPHRYDPLSRFFHWAVLIAVLAAWGIGVYREDLPKNDFRVWLMSLHMSVGLLALGLSVARLGWRSVTVAPPPVEGSARLRTAAKLGHLALLAAAIAVPVLGLLAGWAKARDIQFFGLFPVPSPIAPNKEWVKPLEELHEVAANAMLILAGLHAAVAIFHHYVLKDGLLSRMSPFAGGSEAPKAEY